MVTIYFGKAAAEKDTFLTKMVKLGNAKPIISDTTRPMRPTEKEGREYYFISKEEFDKRNAAGKYLEVISFPRTINGVETEVWYSSPLVNPDEDWVVVLNPDGIRQYLKEYGSDKISLIYVFADDAERKKRYLNRGGSKKEWEDRLIVENEMFSDKELVELAKLYGKPIKTLNNTGNKPRFGNIGE